MTHASWSPDDIFDPQPLILRLPDTLRLVGVSTMTLWRWERAGTFPKRIRLGGTSGHTRAVGHDYQEVMAWLEARKAERRDSKKAS